MYGKIKTHLEKELADIKEAGLYKNERIITSAQGADITVSTGEEVLNFCANNYLGLSNHPDLVEAAKQALDTLRENPLLSRSQRRLYSSRVP